ncbi:hypothetical protein LTR37_001524 [Vermiconidia calcicola]|uniref:Uncharacterized protein n=1 Tax=Vermiconidia calcicola TaxID=1690605 RepID=A0ACC3NVI5_9PEZI|nr:hypothetical protein LTR37_001524 [Vermiconidia calcicola]
MNTVELLEQILLMADGKSVFFARRTCKTLLNMIDTSKLLRKKLFLEKESYEAESSITFEDCAYAHEMVYGPFGSTTKRTNLAWKQHSYKQYVFNDIALKKHVCNTLFFQRKPELVICPTVCFSFLPANITTRYKILIEQQQQVPESKLLKMYLTKPSTTEVMFRIELWVPTGKSLPHCDLLKVKNKSGVTFGDVFAKMKAYLKDRADPAEMALKRGCIKIEHGIFIAEGEKLDKEADKEDVVALLASLKTEGPVPEDQQSVPFDTDGFKEE